MGRRFKKNKRKLDPAKTYSVWRRFSRYTSREINSLVIAFVMSLGVIAAHLAAPWPIKVIFDYILSSQQDESRLGRALGRISAEPTVVLVWVCAAVMIIALLNSFFTYMRDILLAKTGQRVVGRMRRDLFKHLQCLAPRDLEKHHTGSLLVRLTGDIQALRRMLVETVVSCCENGLLILSMIAAMFWLNPTLALLGVCMMPLTGLAAWRISRQITQATNKQREHESGIASIAEDVLGAMAIVQAFNREPIEQKRFARQNRSSIRAGVVATRLASKLHRVVSLFSAVGLCAILYVGVRAVLSGGMTAGDLLVFLSYLKAVNKPMRATAKLVGKIAKATACGQRLAEMFEISPSIHDRPDARPLEKVRGHILFDHVSFEYQPNMRVLSDLSLSIAAGERIAVVGHTGAGKSTLVKLLLRFYDPVEGGVLIDGRDVRGVTLLSLRGSIGWVHQDTVLFGMTVAENIALGCPDAEKNRIIEAARSVKADEFIEALPNGYDTVLKQGASDLSGGQRRRMALARALLREPAILLLDEPATGLDAKTRCIVEEAWMSPYNKATTIVICHTLHDMDRFDRIVVISEGRVAEQGSHRDLLADGASLYAELFTQDQRQPILGAREAS